MEKSMLYDLIESGGFLQEWADIIKENDECRFQEQERDKRQLLISELNESGKKLLTEYTLAVENKVDYLNYNLKIKILNLGVKIGMELQKAFEE